VLCRVLDARTRQEPVAAVPVDQSIVDLSEEVGGGEQAVLDGDPDDASVARTMLDVTFMAGDLPQCQVL
jgi:hypothetical protein